MVGVPFLVMRWLSGPSAADRLAAALAHAQDLDQRPAEEEAEDERGEEGAAGAEGDVAEDVERVQVLRQLGQVVEHLRAYPSGASAGRASPIVLIASTTWPTREPSEPLTMAMSPASTQPPRARRHRLGVREPLAALRRRQRLVERAHPRAGAVHRRDRSRAPARRRARRAARARAARAPACRRGRRRAGRATPGRRRPAAARRRRPRAPPPSPPGWRCSSRRSA